jgi:hypothetical protein
MKTFALALVLSFIAACGLTPDYAQDTKDVIASPIPTWIAGEYQCKTGYFNVKAAGTTVHTGLATYTIAPDVGSFGVLRGKFSESFTSDGSPLRTFLDKWAFDGTEPDKSGKVPADLGMLFGDGASIVDGVGTATTFDPATGLIGVASFDGLYVRDNEPTLTWHRTIFVLPNPTRFTERRREGWRPNPVLVKTPVR